MPSIRDGDIACAEWPDVRGLKHLLQLLDVIDNALNIHATAVYRTNFWRRKALEWARLRNGTPSHTRIPELWHGLHKKAPIAAGAAQRFGRVPHDILYVYSGFSVAADVPVTL